MNLANAKTLVTGGSSGIGLETARALRAKGAQVAICGRDEARVQKAAAEIDALAIAGDVSVEADAVRIVRTVVERFGDYDMLINNAGFGIFAPLVETRLEDMQRVYATNVFGAMLVARESAKHFIARNRGNIVNIASTAGQRGFAGGTSYATSKFALTGLTECWRAELRKNNIRVMQVNPSEVQTEFVAASGRPLRAFSDRKLIAPDIAHTIVSMLELDNRDPRLSVIPSEVEGSLASALFAELRRSSNNAFHSGRESSRITRYAIDERPATLRPIERLSEAALCYLR